MKRKLVALFSSICLILVLAMMSFMAACVPEVPEEEVAPPEEKPPVKIGALLDFTGPIADVGPRFLDGINLALEEANYEVAGRPIEFIYEDTASDPTVALEKIKKLHERDGVSLIVGPLMGNQQLAVIPYAAENKILVSGLINAMDEIVAYHTLLAYPSLSATQNVPLGWYCYDELGYRTMITVCADYAKVYADSCVYGFESRGGKVLQQLWTPVGTADYSPYVASITEDADCFVYFGASGMDCGRLVAAYRESGLEMPLTHILTDAWAPADLAEFGDMLVGEKGNASYVWTRDDPVNNKFVAAFRAKYGRVPSVGQNSYTVTNVILAALEATGGDESFDKIWAALPTLKIDTPQGLLSINSERICITNIYITEIQKTDGEYIVAWLKTYSQVPDTKIEYGKPGSVLISPELER